MSERESYRLVCLSCAKQLEEAGILEAELDARLLMQYVTGWDTATWLLRRGEEMPEAEKTRYEALICRRRKREPLQYITGEQEFMGLSFFVTPHVLIPRQDTELLVEQALPYAKGRRVLDVCTGSGCVLISLARFAAPQRAVGADISLEALQVAKRNAQRHAVQAEWVKSDLLCQVEGAFDVITANPPYIDALQMQTLMPEVGRFEPKLALFGGEDGLVVYRRLVSQAKQKLARGGALFVEIGCEQAQAVTELFLENGFCDVAVCKDYAGHDRVVKGFVG